MMGTLRLATVLAMFLVGSSRSLPVIGVYETHVFEGKYFKLFEATRRGGEGRGACASIQGEWRLPTADELGHTTLPSSLVLGPDPNQCYISAGDSKSLKVPCDNEIRVVCISVQDGGPSESSALEALPALVGEVRDNLLRFEGFIAEEKTEETWVRGRRKRGTRRFMSAARARQTKTGTGGQARTFSGRTSSAGNQKRTFSGRTFGARAGQAKTVGGRTMGAAVGQTRSFGGRTFGARAGQAKTVGGRTMGAAVGQTRSFGGRTFSGGVGNHRVQTKTTKTFSTQRQMSGNVQPGGAAAAGNVNQAGGVGAGNVNGQVGASAAAAGGGASATGAETAAQDDGQWCMGNWTNLGSRCVMLVENSLTWGAAKESCETYIYKESPATMADFSKEEMQTNVMQWLKEKKGDGSIPPFWISGGGNDCMRHTGGAVLSLQQVTCDQPQFYVCEMREPAIKKEDLV